MFQSFNVAVCKEYLLKVVRCLVVGGLQEIENVKGFSTSIHSRRRPYDVVMTSLSRGQVSIFGYPRTFIMQNPWFSQEILTNGDMLLDWMICAILINFNQYVCCVLFLFFLNCTHVFTSLLNLMTLCSVLHKLTIGFNEQYDCFCFFYPLLLRPTNYLDVHLRTQKDLSLLL